MSTTVKYDDFVFHAKRAETRIIYASDFCDYVDGWSTNNTIFSGLWATSCMLRYRADTATGSKLTKRTIFTIGKKYKVTGKVYVNGTNAILKSVRIHDGYGVILDNITDKDQWVSFDVELTAVSELLIFYGMNSVPDYSWASAGTTPYDEFFIKNIVVTEIADGFPTPYVSRSQAPISYGNRWGQETSYTLNGQITGSSFDDLIYKQSALLSGFSRDFKNLTITEDGGNVAGFPASGCRITNIDFAGNKYANILDYTINIKSSDEGLFSGTYGVMDPSDQINFSEGEDGKISVSHEISARGIPANGKSSIDNAKDFVHANSGWKGHLVPHFVKYQDTKVAFKYFSDFTTHDGWGPTDGDRTWGQTIGGETNCMKYTASQDDSSTHYLFRDGTLTIGTKYRIIADIYIGNETNQTINVVEISDNSTAGAGFIIEGGSRATWVTLEKEFIAAGGTLHFKAKESSTDYTFAGDLSPHDWFAIKNVTIQEVFDFNPILTTQNESINRMNGVYSMSESYSLSSTGENTLISGHSISISSGVDQDFVTVELTASYKGSLGEHIEQVRGKIPSVTSNAYYQIAKDLSQIDNLNTGAINFNISENSGASSIDIGASYDNNILFTGGNAFFDYNVSSRTNELDSRSSIQIQGTIQARGNKLNTAENFLETNINNFTLEGCNHEAKYACYLYNLANKEYKGIVNLNIYTSAFDTAGLWSHSTGNPTVGPEDWQATQGHMTVMTSYGGQTASEEGVLRLQANSNGASHQLNSYLLEIGKKYKVTGEVLINKDAANMTGVTIITNWSSTTPIIYQTFNKLSENTWQHFCCELLNFVPNEQSRFAFVAAPDNTSMNATNDWFQIRNIVITEIHYTLNPYPQTCSLSKNEIEGTISLSASFTDDYMPSTDVKSANWSISVTPPLRKYTPTSDIITYPKHIFWNTRVLARSTIDISASASSYDSINKSYGLTTVDNFITNVYNTYIEVNSDIAEQKNSLSFSELDLSYKRNRGWAFHNPEEWITLPAPPKP